MIFFFYTIRNQFAGLMGFIENGRIEGLIPEKTLFAVNYPGYPSSLDRAVETLGGQEAISKV